MSVFYTYLNKMGCSSITYRPIRIRLDGDSIHRARASAIAECERGVLEPDIAIYHNGRIQGRIRLSGEDWHWVRADSGTDHIVNPVTGRIFG